MCVNLKRSGNSFRKVQLRTFSLDLFKPVIPTSNHRLKSFKVKNNLIPHPETYPRTKNGERFHKLTEAWDEVATSTRYQGNVKRPKPKQPGKTTKTAVQDTGISDLSCRCQRSAPKLPSKLLAISTSTVCGPLFCGCGKKNDERFQERSGIIFFLCHNSSLKENLVYSFAAKKFV